jgi:hypothetical protein
MNLPLSDFIAGLKTGKIFVLDSHRCVCQLDSAVLGGLVKMIFDAEKQGFAIAYSANWHIAHSDRTHVELEYDRACFKLEPADLTVIDDDGFEVLFTAMETHIKEHVRWSTFIPDIFARIAPATPLLLKRDGAADISCIGSLIARVVEREPNVMQWDELNLYKTIGGTYIAEQLAITKRPRAKIVRKAAVCKSMEEVTNFFGSSKAAEELDFRTPTWFNVSMKPVTDQTYVLARDKDADIKFSGHRLGTVSSKASRPRWTQLSLYQTTAGRYICEIKGVSTVDSEVDRSEVHTADTLDQVFRYFGHGRLAKQLYAAADLQCVEEVA